MRKILNVCSQEFLVWWGNGSKQSHCRMEKGKLEATQHHFILGGAGLLKSGATQMPAGVDIALEFC